MVQDGVLRQPPAFHQAVHGHGHGNEAPGNGGGTGAAIGLDDIAIQGNGMFPELS